MYGTSCGLLGISLWIAEFFYIKNKSNVINTNYFIIFLQNVDVTNLLLVFIQVHH